MTKIYSDSRKKKELDKEEPQDNVNHPKHYTILGFEVIDILEAITPHYPKKIVGHIWNTLKYQFRVPFKGKLLEDLKKSRFYLDRAIDILEKEEKEEE